MALGSHVDQAPAVLIVVAKSQHENGVREALLHTSSVLARSAAVDLDLIRRARSLSTDILILVITVFGDEGSVVGAIEAGAQGYLLKSEAPADLRESVLQVLSGGAPISPGIASHLLRRFRHTESSGDPVGPAFTPRERDVLTLMVKGLPYLEAAEILGVTRNTIAGHVKSIYAKLEVSSRGEAVYEALSQGIVSLDSKD